VPGVVGAPKSRSDGPPIWAVMCRRVACGRVLKLHAREGRALSCHRVPLPEFARIRAVSCHTQRQKLIKADKCGWPSAGLSPPTMRRRTLSRASQAENAGWIPVARSRQTSQVKLGFGGTSLEALIAANGRRAPSVPQRGVRPQLPGLRTRNATIQVISAARLRHRTGCDVHFASVLFGVPRRCLGVPGPLLGDERIS
jgi:hypothetical protein